MTDIASLLRSAAKSGRLNYFSVAFSDGKWHASYRGVETRDIKSVENIDIITAITGALTPPRAKKEPEEELL